MTDQKADSACYRLVVMGSPRVGKSSLISQFLYREFTPTYKPTLGDLYVWDISVEGNKCQLEIVDTSGSRTYLRQVYISTGQIFVLVHSLEDPESFEDVLQLLEAINHMRSEEQVPIFVVGSKTDQRSAETMSIAEAELRLMDYMDVVRYAETDCRCAGSVTGVFSEILRLVLGADLRAEELQRKDSKQCTARKLEGHRRR